MEFPESFVSSGGFDLVIGNPPWEAEELVEKMLADVKRVMHGVADLMPTHEDFIAKNCKA